MGYHDYSQHTYKIIRLSKEGKEGKEISSVKVIGSRLAFQKQQDLEDQGFPVAIFNVTRGIEEYRTGEDDN